MDKRDIYEHLAKIYLDASVNKTRKNKKYPVLRIVFFLSITLVLVAAIVGIPALQREQYNPGSEIALVLQPGLVKINFNFNPAQKEIYSVDLNKLNLGKYKSIAFAARKTNYSDKVKLRVELSNSFKENSEVYISNITTKWNDFRISLGDFSKINDWTEMSNISFIVEEWNVTKDHGVLYIDNVRFVK